MNKYALDDSNLVSSGKDIKKSSLDYNTLINPPKTKRSVYSPKPTPKKHYASVSVPVHKSSMFTKFIFPTS